MKNIIICSTYCLFYFFTLCLAQKPHEKTKFSDSVKIEIKKLGHTINTSFEEYAPVISADGLQMFFTSRRPFTEKEIKKNKESKEKIYFSTKADEKHEWKQAEALPEKINNPFRNVSSIAVSNDGQKLLIYFDDNGNGEIYESFLKGTEWTEPISLGFPINTEYHESSASFAPDGKTLYFVSNRKGGQGGRDIWVSTLQKDGKWSTPVNLGELINTSDDEEAVYIHPDGKTMYFSSKGHKGLGGYDIFVSTMENGQWTTPVNLESPINTAGDDVFLVVEANGKKGYYASSGNKDKDKDIYEVLFTKVTKKKNEPKLTLVKGIVIDAETKQPIGAEITVIDNQKNSVVGEYNSNKSSGNFLVSLPGGKNYGFNVIADGYIFHSENFNVADTSGYKEYYLKIELTKIKEGAKVILKNIFFDFDKATLRQESFPELDRVVELLNKNPNIKVEISGHTDSKGSDEYNKKLSHARAKSVVEYLISKGISAVRLTYKGYGEEQPVATNDTEEGRQMNRRVEFKVISVK